MYMQQVANQQSKYLAAVLNKPSVHGDKPFVYKHLGSMAQVGYTTDQTCITCQCCNDHRDTCYERTLLVAVVSRVAILSSDANNLTKLAV
jgi:hypothetical protein